LFSYGKLETLETELSQTSCGGKSCSASGGFQTMLIVMVVVGLASA